jgi:hypothetical protein
MPQGTSMQMQMVENKLKEKKKERKKETRAEQQGGGK